MLGVGGVGVWGGGGGCGRVGDVCVCGSVWGVCVWGMCECNHLLDVFFFFIWYF